MHLQTPYGWYRPFNINYINMHFQLHKYLDLRIGVESAQELSHELN